MSLLPPPPHILSALHNDIPTWVLPSPVGGKTLATRQARSYLMAPHATCTKSDAQTQVSAVECTDFYESDEGIHHIDLAASSWKPSLPRLSLGGVELLKYSSHVHSLKSGRSKTYWGISALILASIILLAGSDLVA